MKMMFQRAIRLFTALFFLQIAQARRCLPGSEISVAGSSTVKPIAVSWAAAYMALQCPDADVLIEGGGSSTGAGRVCANVEKGSPVVIGDMSRQWKDSEAMLLSSSSSSSSSTSLPIYRCRKGDSSRSVIQIDVAIDGLSVATKINSDVSKCIKQIGGLTMDQLRWIYSSYSLAELEATGWDPSSLSNSDGDDNTHLWSELSIDCPQVEIQIAGPDSESGTYEYFLETVLTDHDNGETFDEKRPEGYFDSEEDEEIVHFLDRNENTIAYFGYSYYFVNQDRLTATPIQNSDGNFVLPTPETVGDGSYNPLARRIYMNLLNTPQALQYTAPFIEFGFSKSGSILVEGVGYVPIPETERAFIAARLSELAPKIEAEVQSVDDSLPLSKNPTSFAVAPSIGSLMVAISLVTSLWIYL